MMVEQERSSWHTELFVLINSDEFTLSLRLSGSPSGTCVLTDCPDGPSVRTGTQDRVLVFNLSIFESQLRRTPVLLRLQHSAFPDPSSPHETAAVPQLSVDGKKAETPVTQ